jgi:hypothetical protein
MLNSEIMKFTGLGLLTMLMSLLNFSCVERIDIKLDESYTRLVVEGAITTDTMVHTVLLSSTTSYYYNQEVPPVTGAILSITDGTDEYIMHEDEPGVYRTGTAVCGVPGKTYTLNIKLKAPVGGYDEYTA